MSRVYHGRLVAELARAEEMAYGDVARLLSDLDQRAKVEGRAMTETDKSRHDQIPHMRLLARSTRVIVGISIADVNAAVDVKLERSAAMLGTAAPLRIDAVQLVQDTGPAAHSERIRVVLDQWMGKTDWTIDGEVIKEDGDG